MSGADPIKKRDSPSVSTNRDASTDRNSMSSHCSEAVKNTGKGQGARDHLGTGARSWQVYGLLLGTFTPRPRGDERLPERSSSGSGPCSNTSVSSPTHDPKLLDEQVATVCRR